MIIIFIGQITLFINFFTKQNCKALLLIIIFIKTQIINLYKALQLYRLFLD